MKGTPEYQKIILTPENIPFTTPIKVSLLAVTTSTLPIEDFTAKEWQDLNSATTVAGEAALGCYSKKLFTPLQRLTGSDHHREKLGEVVKDTRESGHNSTRQHVYYLFSLEGVSRRFIHQVLHSYPFHNSDQQSQRYVEMRETGLLLPKVENQTLQEIINSNAQELFQGYQQINKLLIPTTANLLRERFPKAKQEKINLEAEKKSQEVGRYLLPLGMGAHLYHSVSELVLMRLHHLANTYPCANESQAVINAMVEAVCQFDPQFKEELSQQLTTQDIPEANFSFDPTSYYQQADRVDQILKGKPAKFDETLNAAYLPEQLANAVRMTLGTTYEQLTDEQAIDLVLNPAKNKLLASTLGETTMNQLSQALFQINLTATVSISHVADSQFQRHRGLFHSQPINLPIPRLDRDIVIPSLIKHVPKAEDLYLKLHENNIINLERLLDAGLSLDIIAYSQTNATKIRKRVNGPLGHWYYWIKTRTCLAAQEEIYHIAVPLASDMNRIAHLGQYFHQPAPCGVRSQAGVRPYCSEGSRYCGVPIWKQTLENYPTRII